MRSASYALAFAALVVAAALAGPAPATARTLSARCAADVQGPAYTVAGHTTHRYANHLAVALSNKRRRDARADQLNGLIEREPIGTHRHRSRLLPQPQDR